MWTSFSDRHSGGGTKIKSYEEIIIEAPEGEAKEIFEDFFFRDPENVTCNCCGRDYSISSEDTLEQLTGFERGCRYVVADGRYLEQDEVAPEGCEIMNGRSQYLSLESYLALSTILVVRRVDIEAAA